jgi:RNA polymerase sigma-70 factor (ECF subfamily)
MIFRITGKKSEKRSDEELLKEFRQGNDPAVLGEIYSAYMHLVYGVCLKYLKDRDESKDAVMQIFEKLITEIPKHNIENFRRWLHVVAKNHCLMQLRTKKSHDEKMGEWAADNIVFMENEYDLHPIDGDTSEIDKALEDCIELLREEQKSCIRLFYYENRCYSEIAANLRLDEKKVKSHLQNGKRNLKICLEEKNEGKRER